MDSLRIVSFFSSSAVRALIIITSVILVGLFIFSHIGLGMNPFIQSPRIFAVFSSASNFRDGNETLKANPLVEVKAIGSFGAVLKPINLSRQGEYPTPLLRIFPDALEALNFVTTVRIASDVTMKERPEATAPFSSSLSKETVTLVRATRNGWIELWSKDGWGWVPLSSVQSLSGKVTSEIELYTRQNLDEQKGILTNNSEVVVLGKYDGALLISSEKNYKLSWVEASDVEVR